MSVTVNKPPLRDRIIPWYFVMAFAVVFVVNSIFVYVATTTNQGVVTENPYEKGLAYDDTLAQKRQQQALGWQAHIKYAERRLQYTLKNQSGAPIEAAKVDAYIERPIEKGVNQTVSLIPLGNGRYEASLNLPLKGQWDVTISSLWKQQYHQSRSRLVVR